MTVKHADLQSAMLYDFREWSSGSDRRRSWSGIVVWMALCNGRERFDIKIALDGVEVGSEAAEESVWRDGGKVA